MLPSCNFSDHFAVSVYLQYVVNVWVSSVELKPIHVIQLLKRDLCRSKFKSIGTHQQVLQTSMFLMCWPQLRRHKRTISMPGSEIYVVTTFAIRKTNTLTKTKQHWSQLVKILSAWNNVGVCEDFSLRIDPNGNKQKQKINKTWQKPNWTLVKS